MPISNSSDFFLNFQKLGQLKLEAKNQTEGASDAVARQFEGLFVQQMLAAMRSASAIDDGQQSEYLDFYQDMYDKQLAQTIAGKDALGVSKMILQQLPASSSSVTSNEAALSSYALSVPSAEIQLPMLTNSTPAMPFPVSVAIASPLSAASTPTDLEIAPTEVDQADDSSRVVLHPVLDNDFAESELIHQTGNRWQDADTYVADIWSGATQAAQKLGVSADLLVAQSALETGWGKHTIKFADGQNSFNLFGLKADSSWQGASVSKSSLEFRDGELVNEVSRFRAYASPQESLDDYVDFIQSNPRYEKALQQRGDDQGYIREIHRAGYATDPAYVEKIITIRDGEQLRYSLASLTSEESNNA
ncbi:MAG: flagellar protein FlgJ [Planctomycetota bacterium]|jgi:flagellar protein FlgJ